MDNVPFEHVADPAIITARAGHNCDLEDAIAVVVAHRDPLFDLNLPARVDNRAVVCA
jgi:hypothetical protein